MFGLFDSDLKRVRRLRLEYEDIRQRVLHKMNPYEQYSFISAYRRPPEEIQEAIEATFEDDIVRWRQLGGEIKEGLQEAWRESRRMPGIAGEGSRAGVNGLALLSVLASAKGYRLAEALTLKDDIDSFAAQIDKLVNEEHGFSS